MWKKPSLSRPIHVSGFPMVFPWFPSPAKLLNCLWSISRQTLKKPQDQGLHLNSIDANLGDRNLDIAAGICWK